MMKILLFVILLVLIPNIINAQPEPEYFCSNGDLNINNRMEDSQEAEFGTYETFSGVLEICYNNSYSNVCLNTSDVNATEVAQIACNNFGYYDASNGFAGFRSRDNPDLIGSIDCPPYAYGFSECTLDSIDAEDCPPNQDLYIYCSRFVQSPSYCTSDGETYFSSDSYFSFSNGLSYSVGYPLLCINNTYTPYCSSITNQLVADYYCSSYDSALSYPAFGQYSDYELNFTPRNIINSLYCPPDAVNISNCTYSFDGECLSEQYGLITCVQSSSDDTCRSGDIRSANEIYIEYPTSRRTTSSRIQICSENNELIDICSDIDLDEEAIISIACYSDVTSAQILEWDYENYGLSSSGLYATNITCSDYVNYTSSFDDYCNYTESTVCNGTPLVVQCVYECDDGSVRLYNNQIASTDDGNLTITGILEVCVDNQWATVCDDGTDFDNDAALQRACESMGYAGGKLIYPDPVTYGYSDTIQVIYDVECPETIYSFSDCNYTITYNDTCINHMDDYLLQCEVSENRECYSTYDIQLYYYNVNIYFPNGTQFLIAYPQLCNINYYSYAAICSSIITDYEADQICMSTGYTTGYAGALYGDSNDYYPLLTEDGVNEYYCPDYAYSIYDCQFNFTDGIGCTEENGPGQVTCITDQGSCTSGFRLADEGSGNLPNGRRVYVGRAEVCLNGTYAPLCNSIVDDNLAQLFCYQQFGSEYIGFPYPVVGNRSDYGSSDSDEGVFGLDCEYYETGGYCDTDNLNYTETGGCMNYDGHAIISCVYQQTTPPQPSGQCNYTGQVTLVNRYPISPSFGNSPGGLEGFGGLLEICINDTFHRVCVNDTYSDVDANDLARRACADLGLITNLFFITGAYYPPSVLSVIDDVDCMNNANTGLSSCYFNTTDTGQCYSHDYDAYLMCFNSIPICYDGKVRVSNNNTNTFQTYEEFGGTLEICANGRYTTVCGLNETNFNASVLASVVCNDLGYPDGSSYSTGYGLDYNEVINNIICPYDFSPLFLCNFSTINNGSCADSINSVQITCRRNIIPACVTGDYRLRNSTTNDYGNYEEIKGPLEICLDGTYIPVCGDTDAASVNISQLSMIACNGLGYPDGYEYNTDVIYSVMNNPVIDYLDCPVPYYYDDFSNCSISITSNEPCANHTNDIFLTCRRDTPTPCYDGQVRIGNNYTNSYNDYNRYIEEINGYLEICFNETFYPVCGEDDVDLNATEVVELACLQLGYDNGSSYYPQCCGGSYNTPGIDYIECSENVYSLSQCSFNTSSLSDTCSNHYNDLFVTCRRSLPSCSGSLFRYQNTSYFYFANNTQVQTGRVEVCVDGTYIPVCADGLNSSLLSQPMSEELNGVCSILLYNSEVLIDQYIGDVSDYQTREYYVVESLTCPSSPDHISDCEYSTSYNGCYSRGGQAVLTCIQREDNDECYSGDIRLSNSSRITFPYGSESITGRVETCYNGTYVDVCSDTQYAQYFGDRSCSSLTFNSTVPYESLYSSADSGRIIDFEDCGDDLPYYPFEECNITETCQSSPLIVYCESECSSFGVIRLAQFTNDYYDNGTSGTTGILQFCNDGEWGAVCSESLREEDITVFCNQLGYFNGSIASSNPGGDLSNVGQYLNLSCPDYSGYSPSSCSISYDDSQCETDQDTTYLYCYNGVQESCYDGSVRIGDNYYQESYASGQLTNGTYFRIGYAEICINGTYRTVCNQDLSINVASALCRSGTGYNLGYPGALYGDESDFGPVESGDGLYNLSCPPGSYWNDYDCTYTVTYGNRCNDYNDAALITCLDVTVQDESDSCFNGSASLASRGYGYFFNGSSFSIGRPQLCSMNEYVPLCTSITEDEATVICYSSEGQYGARLYPIIGTPSDFGSDSESSNVVNDFTCLNENFDFQIYDCDIGYSNSTDGCLSYYPQPVITCLDAPQPCRDFSTRLNYVSYTYYSVVYSVDICLGNLFGTACADGFTDEFAYLICQERGYEGGYVSTDYNATYVTGNRAYTNFTCPEDYDTLLNCTYDVVDDCDGDEAIIECVSDIPTPCYDGQVRIGNNYTNSYNDYNRYIEEINGYLEICFSETFYPVCGEDDVDLNATEVVELACLQLGYDNGSSYYTQCCGGSYNTPGIDYIECSENVSSLSQCSFNTSSLSDTCSDHYNDIYVTCRRSLPACSGSLFRYQNTSYFYFANNTQVQTGRVEVCVDGTYIPVCADGLNSSLLSQPMSEELNGVCSILLYNSEVLIDQYIGDVSDYQTREYYVVESLTCPSSPDHISDCEYNTSYNGCYSRGGQAVLTCIQREDNDECYSGDIRLSNSSRITFPYGSESITGRVEACYNGTYVDVCSDTQYAQYFGDRSCSSLTFNSTVPYESLYSSADSGRIIDFEDCGDNLPYYPFEECNITGTCQSSPLIVYCESECSSFGVIRLAQFTTDYYDNGTSGTTGILQFCNDGEWGTVCSESLREEDITVFCNQLGYFNGSIVSSNPGGDLSNVGQYLNLSCPDYSGYSPSSCYISYDDSQCETDQDTTYLYCYNGVQESCYDGSVRIGDNYYQESYASGQLTNGTYFRIGYAEICINGTYRTVCNQDLSINVASALCRSGTGYNLGYPGALYGDESDFGPVESGDGLYNLSCPPGSYWNDYDCTYTVTYGNRCNDYNDAALITCLDVTVQDESDSCFNGSASLASRGYGYFFNGSSFSIGRPQLCSMNEYVPLCTSITEDEATVICYSSEGQYGARLYPIIGTPSDFGSDSESSNVVNDFTCLNENFDFQIYDCDIGYSNSTDGCLSYYPQPVITCLDAPQPCRDFSTSLNYIDYVIYDTYYSVVYSVDVCLGNLFGTACADGFTDEFAYLICQERGYEDGYVSADYNASYVTGNRAYTNFTCPEDYDTLLNCTYDVVDDCDGDEAIIECVSAIAICYPGQVRLANSINETFDDDSEYISGYPVICADNEFVPLCNNTRLGPREIIYICAVSTNFTYGFIGVPDFYALPPFTEYNTSNITVNFTCNDEFECRNNTLRSNDSCDSYGDYATVTCAIECDDGIYRFYNSRTTYTPDDLLRVTGIPQRCVEGTWGSLCSDDTNDPDVPSILCQEFGYRDGRLLPPDRALYGSSPRGTLFFNNFQCPYNAISLDDCEANITFSEECLSGDLEYVLQCFDVQTSSQLIQPPLNSTLLQENQETASFSCVFTGYPQPQISWTFTSPANPNNPQPIVSGDQYYIVTIVEDMTYMSTLNVSNVMFSNTGAYSCIGMNGAPVPAVGVGSLIVLVRPTLTLTSSLRTINETESTSLSCQVEGSYPGLPVTWLKDGSPVIPNSRITLSGLDPILDINTGLYNTDSTLNIDNAAVADSGTYSCFTPNIPPFNPILDSLTEEIVILVQVRNECIIQAPDGQLSPCVEGYCIDGDNMYFCQCFDGYTGTNCDEEVTTTDPPVFVTEPADQRLLLDGRANFSCIVTGQPKPRISWFKDGDVIPSEISPYLIILDVQPSNRGVYSCSATNSEGSIQSRGALLLIQNVAQYISVVTFSSNSTRRRRQELPPALEMALAEARIQFIGREIAPGASIYAIDGVITDSELQIIFSIRVPVTSTGAVNTDGVTDGLNNVVDEVAMANPGFEFSTVQRFDGCLPESTTVFGNVNITWPEIGTAEVANVPCPCGSITDTTGLYGIRTCGGDFVSIGAWETPDIRQCQYNDESRRLCQAAALDNPLAESNVLSNVSNNAENFGVDTVNIAVSLLENLGEFLEDEDVFNNVLDTINNLFDVRDNVYEESPESASRVLSSIDNIAANVPFGNNSNRTTVTRPQFALDIQVVLSENFNCLTFSVELNSDGQLDDNSLSGDSASPAGSLELPNDLLIDVIGSARLAFGTLTGDSLFVQNSTGPTRSLRSIILSFDVYSSNGTKVIVSNLQTPVSLSFEVSEVTGNLLCAFWDEETSEFSTEGCTTVNNGEEGILNCECDHLSFFCAVEEQGPTTEGPSTEGPTSETEYEPEAIIFVGCIIALFIVVLAIISHLISASLRNSHEGKILVTSHLTLIILYIIIILATAATYANSDGFCGFSSGVFHYISIVYFMWIFAEGLYYVIKLRYGIGGSPLTRRYFIIMLMLCWLLPVFIVIISVAAGHEYYALDNAFCRPQQYPFWYGYIIPVVIIYILALVCHIFSIFTLILNPMNSAETIVRKQTTLPHLVVAIILHVGFGIVWIFALTGTDYSVVDAPSTATQYIFGFLLIIHAILVFVLTLVRTEKTRNAWRSCLNRATGRSAKYEIAAVSENVYQKKEEAIGLGSSGRFSSEGSLKKKPLDSDDVQPLNEETPDSDDDKQVDTAFTTKEEKETEETKKPITSDTVVVNLEAQEDEEDDEKKTSL